MKRTATKRSSSGNLAVPVNAQDHRQGPPNASLVLIEYGDYQCPYCAEADEVIKDLQSELGDRLSYIFRNFPLQEVHPYALRAAEAAEAAALQGRFWEMHDLLFSNQDALEDEDLVGYAEELDLNLVRFRADLDKTKKRVMDDYEGGLESDVSGTPTFFVNGSRYQGEYDRDDLIAALLNSAKA